MAGNVVGPCTRAGAELDVAPFTDLDEAPTKALADRRAGFPSGRPSTVEP